MSTPLSPTEPVLNPRADEDRTARQIVAGPSKALHEVSDLGIRQGQVQAIDIPNQKCDITLGGDAVVIPGVSHISNYRPAVNDVVWVFTIGNDLLVFDRVGAFGPSVIGTVGSAFVDAAETRTSSSYGDLATVGPSVAVPVSPSGRLLVQVSALMYGDPGQATPWAGGVMGIALSGANTQSPDDREAIELFFSNTVTSAIVTCASKVTLMTGLNPGSTTVTAKYRNSAGSGTGRWSLRHLWALPL